MGGPIFAPLGGLWSPFLVRTDFANFVLDSKFGLILALRCRTQGMTATQFEALIKSSASLAAAYRDGWENVSRPRGSLTASKDLVVRAWAMGRDDAMAYAGDAVRGSVSVKRYCLVA